MTGAKNGRPAQTPAQMRATLLQMAGRINGCTRSEIHDRWDARHSAYAMADAMVAKGELHVINYRRGTWYFACPRAAAAFNPPGQHLGQYPQRWPARTAGAAPVVQRALHIHRSPKLYAVSDLMQHVTPRRLERTPLHLPGTHIDKPLDADAAPAAPPAPGASARQVRTVHGPSWTHDPRYQCAPGEQPHGAGFAAAGVGRDITTGRAWDFNAPAAAVHLHREDKT